MSYSKKDISVPNTSQNPASKMEEQDITMTKTGSINAMELTAFEKNDYKTLINCTDDLLWSIGRDFKLIAANKAFLQNIEDAANISLKPGDNLLLIDFFPKETIAFWEACYRRALSGESFHEEIYAPAFHDRKESWRETSFKPIYKNDAAVGVACYSRDITEKKSAENKIRQSEAYLADAQRLAKLGSWNFDFKTDSLTWSDELYNVFGTDKQTFIETHRSFTELVDEADRDLVLQTSKHTQETGEPFTIEYHITTPKGEKRVIQEHGYGEINADGKVIRLFGTAQDITERKQADEAIQAAYIEKNTILESIDDGFFAVDKNSLVTYWNRKAEILLGEKRENIIGKNLHKMFASPDSGIFYDNYQKAIRENNTVHFEAFSKRSNKWFAVSAFASDSGLSVYFKDITEQKDAAEKIKESELRYRSLIEQATDTICIADAALKLIEINPSGCRLFGYSREEALQLYITDILFEEDLKTTPIQIDKLKAGKTTNTERRIKRKDGTAIDVELSGKMLEDGRLIIFGRDISERKKSERLIKESEAKYRSFFESSMDGILITVTDGDILSANPAACEIFKMTEEEICAAGRFGLTDGTDPRLKILIAERQRTGKAKGELTLVRKDGSKFEAELTSALFTDAYGQNRTSMIVRDITERKLAEQRIVESNERYNLISMATNDMVWDWDIETGKVYRNKEGWKKIFRTGDKESEVGLRDEWDSRIHPEDVEKVKRINNEILNLEKDFYEIECRMLRDDGTYAYVHDRGNIIRNGQGKAVRLIGATEDITARKEAELQIVKSELRFRSLVQNSSDLIGIIDDRGYYLYSSPAVKKILGYEPEFIIGKNSFAFIHPDDISNIKMHFANKNTKGHPAEFAFRFKNAQGSWRWLESKITDMSDNPEVQGYIFNSRDITERKIAEAEINKLSIIARETLNAVIITDPDEKIEWVNEAFTRITGFEPEEVLGKKPGDLLQGEETDLAVVRFMRNEIKQHKAFDCDIINYSKSGRKYWIRIQSQPQFDETGKLKHFFAIQTDISKEKEAEEILKASEIRYRYLFDNNPASIFIWDINDYKMLEVNDTAVKLYGYCREEFLNKLALDLCLPEDIDKIKLLASLARQKSDFKMEITAKHISKSYDEMFMNISSHCIQYKGRPVILAMATNVTEKIYLEKVLENERRLKQHEITEAVISAQEKERMELGGELHDNINQILAGSLLYLGLAKKELKSEHPYLVETDRLISSAIDEIRNLSHTLIPPSLQESEFLEAIGNIITATQKASGIRISLKAMGFEERIISANLKLNIYRIVQEQFNNILKHAGAQKVIVRLIQDNEKTMLSIKDDGVGFDTTKKAKGVGLMNIKTRASLFNGELTIISLPGKGCEVRVIFN